MSFFVRGARSWLRRPRHPHRGVRPLRVRTEVVRVEGGLGRDAGPVGLVLRGGRAERVFCGLPILAASFSLSPPHSNPARPHGLPRPSARLRRPRLQPPPAEPRRRVRWREQHMSAPLLLPEQPPPAGVWGDYGSDVQSFMAEQMLHLLNYCSCWPQPGTSTSTFASTLPP